MTRETLEEKMTRLPVLRELAARRETLWLNPLFSPVSKALEGLPVTLQDMEDAEERLLRFAPFFKEAFRETISMGGILESPLLEINGMHRFLEGAGGCSLSGRLFLKMDSHLPVSGSVKARGGIYEILKHSEELALSAGLVTGKEDYGVFAGREMQDFFSQFSIHVGSTGNLGLSIGIASAALGYRVTVHMSRDAKEWKKALLREKGVTVAEYDGDYSLAVEQGRRAAKEDPRGYFVDDENSKELFLGYSVAAKRLQKQLLERAIPVDKGHPLAVYLPCGVGGAPGGITFGLKQVFGDAVHCFFAEPTACPCMLLGLSTGLHDGVCVQEIGLNGRTEADGLAVGRPSKFVGRTVERMVSGIVTVSDKSLYRFLDALYEREGIFIEPSACAGFEGVRRILDSGELREYAESYGLLSGSACHIVWATGGSLVPGAVREEYLQKAARAREGTDFEISETFRS